MSLLILAKIGLIQQQTKISRIRMSAAGLVFDFSHSPPPEFFTHMVMLLWQRLQCFNTHGTNHNLFVPPAIDYCDQVEKGVAGEELRRLLHFRCRMDRGGGRDGNGGGNSVELRLIDACRDGKTDVALALVKEGADINDIDNHIFRRTPLQLACEYGHTDLVFALMGMGADESKLLHWACRWGQSELALALMEKDIDIHARDESNKYRMPLHWACKRRCTGVAMAMIEKSADLYAMDEDGATSLDLADAISARQLRNTFQRLWRRNPLLCAVYDDDLRKLREFLGKFPHLP